MVTVIFHLLFLVLNTMLITWDLVDFSWGEPLSWSSLFPPMGFAISLIMLLRSYKGE